MAGLVTVVRPFPLALRGDASQALIQQSQLRRATDEPNSHAGSPHLGRSRCHLLFCWAHEKTSVRPHRSQPPPLLIIVTPITTFHLCPGIRFYAIFLGKLLIAKLRSHAFFIYVEPAHL
jgi:hypothetical protein